MAAANRRALPRILSVSGLLFLVCCPHARGQVDFASQIAPLFARSCARCHGGGPEGVDDLLTSPQRARRGGDSGRDLLALPLEENELLRRVRSTEPGDRMPLSGPPLTAEEIELLASWLQAGAAWPTPEPRLGEDNSGPWYERWGVAGLAWFRRVDGRRFLPPVVALLGVAGLGLWRRGAARRVARAAARGEPVAGWRRGFSRIPWSGFAALGLLCGLWGTLIQVTRLQEQNRELQVKVWQLAPPAAFAARYAPPIRPQHPPRMRGEYYRGNDERDPALFNGGFYRTCTFRVELRDPQGVPLEWGSAWPAAASVHLEVRQAPFATKILFDTNVLQMGGLWDADPGTAELVGNERAVHLQPIAGVDGAWQADFPLTIPAGQPRCSGKVFYYRSLPPPGKKFSGEVHYVIGYDLQEEAGKIGDRSQVWMESLYNVNKIDYPEQGKITPAEWFSSLPIPEIVGGNSSDPRLLGVPEHATRLQAPVEPPQQ